MTDYENRLLEQFMQRQKQEITDNGFSRKVIRNLRGKEQKISLLWSIFCWVASLVLFILLDGWEIAGRFLYETGNSFLQETFMYADKGSLVLVGITLVGMGIKKVCSLK